VADARDQFEAAAAARGWTVKRVRDEDTFCRLVVSGPEDLLVDLALDAPPGAPPLHRPDVRSRGACRPQLLALFDRAEARDFADVYVLAQRYGKELVLARTPEMTRGAA